jgi:hypothetical protein
MTFTVTPEKFYLLVIFVLMIIQVYQFRLIHRLRGDHNALWLQVQNLIMTAASAISQLEKKIDGKQDKE